MNPILLDERLSAAAELAREALTGMERPVAADIGCDHGFLTAKLLETVPNLTMLASDVSEPSLEKARRLLAARGLSGRATLAVADGLSAIDRLVDAVMILGMGAGTILKIVSEGRDKIGGAALIVQANVDLPLLRGGLAELGFAVQKEIYCRAAGRHYVTMLARAGMVEMPDERRLMLGACADGVQTAAQYDYLAWQRGVRVGDALAGGHGHAAREERLLWAAMS
ncbi:MAG: tRNA (adenine(22)-N(1))-methyltransferase TrmK [Christensenellales bacterium]